MTSLLTVLGIEPPCSSRSFYVPDQSVIFALSLELLLCVSGSVVSDSLQLQPASSCVHGILQARTLEWVAVPSSRGS